MRSPPAYLAGRLLLATWAVITCLVLGSANLETASAQETVPVRGRVINGTAGAAVPPQLVVLMLVSDQEGRAVSSLQATIDETGRFEFPQAEVVAGGSYALGVDYGGIFYKSTLGIDDLRDEVQVTVYETTQDLSAVRVTRQLLVIAEVEAAEREIGALQFVNLSNGTDRTLVPDLSNPQQMSFLRFSLPPKSREINVPGGQIISVGTGFALTAPVFPGDHTLSFSYRFPYEGNRVFYLERLLQGADLYQVLVPQRLGDIEVAPLQSAPPITLEGITYLAWEGREFDPGQGIVLELSNLPEPSLVSRLSRSVSGVTFWTVAIPGALTAVLCVLLLFGTFRVPGRVPGRVAGAAPAPDVAELGGDLNEPEQREALVRALAALDERFESGEIPAEEYHQRRDGLKTRILETPGPTAVGKQLPEMDRP